MAGKLSKKTERVIEGNMEDGVHEIVEDSIARTDQKKKDFTLFIYVIGIIGPIVASFQALKIFSSGTAAGVSLLYWGAYLLIAVAWFGYGFAYRSRSIMVTYGLWIIIEVIILNGIILYG